MESATLQQSDVHPVANRLAIGRPPIPHEHGAWVILYAPILLGFAAAGAVPALPFLLLVVTVTAAALRRALSDTDRRRLGRDTLVYHALLLSALPLMAAGLRGSATALFLAAYAPIIVRAWLAWSRLSSKLPPLKRVGYTEMLW